jgi:hypothetical protein
MNTQLKTNDYEITLTDINQSAKTAAFTATLTHKYLTAIHNIDIANEFCNGDNEITFNLYLNDNNCLSHDIDGQNNSDDSSDSIDTAIHHFGNAIIAFIDIHCKLNNIPFYPNN